MSDERSNYRSYLLRLYKSERHGRPAWRASLESTRTGERVDFDLEGLLRFLGKRFGPSGLDGQDRNCEPQGGKK